MGQIKSQGLARPPSAARTRNGAGKRNEPTGAASRGRTYPRKSKVRALCYCNDPDGRL